jgi:hypothetical protein
MLQKLIEIKNALSLCEKVGEITLQAKVNFTNEIDKLIESQSKFPLVLNNEGHADEIYVAINKQDAHASMAALEHHLFMLKQDLNETEKSKDDFKDEPHIHEKMVGSVKFQIQRAENALTKIKAAQKQRTDFNVNLIKQKYGK